MWWEEEKEKHLKEGCWKRQRCKGLIKHNFKWNKPSNRGKRHCWGRMLANDSLVGKMSGRGRRGRASRWDRALSTAPKLFNRTFQGILARTLTGRPCSLFYNSEKLKGSWSMQQMQLGQIMSMKVTFSKAFWKRCCCSVAKSCLTATLWAAVGQAPLSPGICSSSCALGWWCYPTISSFSLKGCFMNTNVERCS